MSTPATVTERPRAGDGSRLSFAGVLRSEWIKIWTLRSNWLMVGLSITAVVIIGPLIELPNGNAGGPSPVDPESLLDIALVGAALAEFVLGVFGVLSATNEYATGMIRATLTAEPRRWTVLVAKAIVTGGITIVLGIISCLIAFYAGMALANTTTYVRHTPSLGDPGVARAVILTGVYIGLIALLGQGLGWAIRNTAGAIAALFGLLLVLPIIFSIIPAHFLHDVVKWLPSQAGHDVGQLTTANGDHSPWAAFALVVGYAAASLVAGVIVLVRRDA